MAIEGWDAFVTRVASRPLLTEEREAELARVMKVGGEAGRDAKADLIEANLRLGVSIAIRYAEPGSAYVDLFQAGNIGLVSAVETFHRWGEQSFATFASDCIEQEILKYKRDPEEYATWCAEHGIEATWTGGQGWAE